MQRERGINAGWELCNTARLPFFVSPRGKRNKPSGAAIRAEPR